MTCEETSEDLLVHLDRDVTSRKMQVPCADGRTLRFWVEIRSGGFFASLRGETKDGERWPKQWSVAEDSSSPPYVELPTTDESVTRRLFEAVGVEWTPSLSGKVECSPPAAESGFGGKLGLLLGITDGVTLPGLVILGTSDLYEMKVGGESVYVISDRRDSGALCVAKDPGDERVFWVSPGSRSLQQCEVVAPDVLSMTKSVLDDSDFLRRW